MVCNTMLICYSLSWWSALMTQHSIHIDRTPCCNRVAWCGVIWTVWCKFWCPIIVECAYHDWFQPLIIFFLPLTLG